MLIGVPPRHGRPGFKQQRGEGSSGPPIAGESWSLGGGVAPRAFASLSSQGGCMEGLGIFQQEPN